MPAGHGPSDEVLDVSTRRCRQPVARLACCHFPLGDPCQVDGTDEEKLDGFRRVRDQIDERVRDWLKEMEQHDDSKAAHVVMR
jgi:hypothetical protein